MLKVEQDLISEEGTGVHQMGDTVLLESFPPIISRPLNFTTVQLSFLHIALKLILNDGLSKAKMKSSSSISS